MRKRRGRRGSGGRRARVALSFAAAIVTVATVVGPCAAQTPTASVKNQVTPKAKAWTVPRTPWGDPDLEGLWPGTQMMGVSLERPPQLAGRIELSAQELAERDVQSRRQAEADNEEFVVPRANTGGAGAGTGPPGHWGERGLPQRQTSLVVDPADGRIPPMLPEARTRVAALPHNFFYDNSGHGPFDSPEDLSIYDRCITRGVVGSTLPVGYNAGNQIVQGPGFVAIRYEMIHETRIIPLDDRPHVGSRIRSYMGDARGHWEGTTLVVETGNFNGKTGVTGNGRANYTTDAVHLVERFTRTDADTIQYQVTIDDPKTWTRSWTIAFPLKRDPGYGMFEYACHEGNNAMRNILSGARAGEGR